HRPRRTRRRCRRTHRAPRPAPPVHTTRTEHSSTPTPTLAREWYPAPGRLNRGRYRALRLFRRLPQAEHGAGRIGEDRQPPHVLHLGHVLADIGAERARLRRRRLDVGYEHVGHPHRWRVGHWILH